MVGLSKNIVILEKEYDLAQLISRGLEYEGFKAHIAADPETALELIENQGITLLLLDVRLTKMKDGKDLLTALRGYPVAYIIMLINGDEAQAVQMLEMGARDYLIKDTGFLEFLPHVVNNVYRQIEVENRLAEARENIAKSEEELSIVTENMLELVAKISEEGTFQYVSPSYKTILGYDAEELLGKSAFDFVYPEDLQHAVKAFQKGVTVPQTCNKEFRFKHAKGFYVWLEVKVNLTYDQERKINGTVWISRDLTQRKEIEDKLQNCKDKYRRLLDELPVGVCRTSPGLEGKFIMANQALVKMLGYASEEELKKVHVKDLYLDPAEREEYSKNLLAKGSILGNHLQLKKKDGTLLWCIDNTRVVKDEKDDIQFESIIEDITELKLAKKEISSQKKYFGALFANSTDAIAYINLKHKCLDINSRFTRLFGYTLADLKGKDVDHILAPGQKYQEAKHLTEMVLTGASVNLESVRFNKGGKPLDVNIKGIPVLIDGDITGCYLIFVNITDRKRIEETVQRSEERHREIMAAIEEGYYEMDLAGNITFCNEAAYRLMGLSQKELIGSHFPLLFKDTSMVYRVFHRIYMSGRPEKGFMLEVVKADGKSRFDEFSISLIKDKNGKVQGFRGVGRDITERKKYEEKLRQLSLHDQMTGTYNRTYFEEELRRLEGGRDYPITIICADLDGLKLINDTMGHRQGDELLKTCAQVLKKPLRSSDVLARVGGDEFTAILPRTDEQTGAKIIDRINTALQKNNAKHPALPLSVSLGAATAVDREQPLEEIFKKSDALMYRDKLLRSTSSRTKIVSALLEVLQERDHLSEGHADRLEELSLKIAERLGLSSRQMNDLSLLAQVHDLGKVGIPERVLYKDGTLTADEWEMIRQHPEKGYRIATSSPNLAVVADLILRHHERWDGSGYPLGLKGEEIPIECRILAIIDAYDNMIHGFYNKAMSSVEAIEELRRNSGTQFDPDLVEKIIPILHEGMN